MKSSNEKVPSIKELRIICQSVKFQHCIEGFYRKFSIYFTWILIHTSLSANQATIIQMILGIIGSLLVMTSIKSLAVVGIFFWYFGYLFDFIDGEVARYRKRSTILGLFIDGFNHLAGVAIMFVSVGMYAALQPGGNLYYLLVAIPAAIFSTLPVTAAMKGAVISVAARGKDAYKCADLSSFVARTVSNSPSSKKQFENFLINKVQAAIRYPWPMIIFTFLIIIHFVVGETFLPFFLIVLLMYSLVYIMANILFFILWCKENETARLYNSLKSVFKEVENG